MEPSIATLFARMKAGNDARRSSFGLTERRDALDRLAQAIRASEADLVAALQSDLGRPEAETILIDYLPILQEIRHTRRHLRRWMKPRRVAPTLASFGATARIVPQPRGTCLIIAPWNLPFHAGAWPACLVPGRRAMRRS
jgi:aldehyde dehydrogenase (NAD+)